MAETSKSRRSTRSTRSSRASRASRRSSHILDESLIAEMQEQFYEDLQAEKQEALESNKNVFVDRNENEFRILLIKEKTYIIQQKFDAFCAKWSADGDKIAVGTTGGTVEIFGRYKGRSRVLHSYSQASCTALNWVTIPSVTTEKPGLSVNFDDSSNDYQALLAAQCDGTISLWDIATNKMIFRLKEENDIYALQHNKIRNEFVTAGKDRYIRVYDMETQKEKNKFNSGYYGHTVEKQSFGHRNRIFSLNFKDNNESILVSGSWDNNIFVWDLRSFNIVRTIHGPHVAGQAVDLQGNILVSGSWRDMKGIQTWDFMSGKMINEYNVKCAHQNKVQSLLIYQCSFAKAIDGIGLNKKIKIDGLCAIAGTGANCTMLMDTKNGGMSNVLRLNDLTSPSDAKTDDGVYCVDIDPMGEYIVYGGNQGKCCVAKIETKPTKRNRRPRVDSVATLELLAL